MYSGVNGGFGVCEHPREPCKSRLPQRSLTQLCDHCGIDFGAQEQLADAGALVGAVETGIKLRVAGAEGDAAGDLVDVGAAADGLAVALLPLKCS